MSMNFRKLFVLVTVLCASVLGSSLIAQEITVWSGFPEQVPYYERVAKTLQARMPGVTVNIEAIGLRDHEKRLALGLQSGDAAEVVELTNTGAQRYIDGGFMQKAPSSVANMVTNKRMFGNFQASSIVGGSVYGVPIFRGQSALFYNTKMLAAAGLSSPPKTMEQYFEYAKKLTQRDSNGNPTVSGWSLRLSGGGAGIAEKFWVNMFQFGGNLVVPAGNGKWRSNLANDAGVKALAQYVNLLHGSDKALTMSMKADADAFSNGLTAMFMRESWVIGKLAKESPNLEYKTAVLPTGAIVVPVNLYVSADGKKGDAAWEFTKEAVKPEHMVWMLDNVGWLPNRQDVDYSAVLKAKPAFDAFVNFPSNYKFFNLPAIGPSSEILTRVAVQLESAFVDSSLVNNNAAIKAALQVAEDDVNKILKREGLLGN